MKKYTLTIIYSVIMTIPWLVGIVTICKWLWNLIVK